MLAMLCAWLCGCECCHMRQISHPNEPVPVAGTGLEQLVASIEYTDVANPVLAAVVESLPPRSLADGPPREFWDLSLADAMQIGLQSSEVLRELGGRVLNIPSAVSTVYDPSITMSHPRIGEEAALAAFDAQWQQTLSYVDGKRVFNNTALGGGATEVTRDGFNLQNQLQKTSATGTRFSLRNDLSYENSDAPFNLFPSAWTGNLEASVRQPLLQGAGVLFNRTVGPNAVVDLALTRGVILARMDGDISIAQFERGVREFVVELETTYWQLYAAYRGLDANRRARDLARNTWQAIKSRDDANLRGGEADAEAQAREQMYLFEQQVVNSLNGTSANGITGVYQAERRLRRVLGLPMNDGKLIRPLDEPSDAPVRFDWESCLAEALDRRVELREQSWRVKQRQLELLAARNFLQPRLDAVAAYRLSGLGDDLLGGSGPNSNLGRELFSFGNDEVEAGLQLNVPIGYRRELAGVRHSELNLSRARAILRDQQHQISHDLADAVARPETTHESLRLGFERLVAAEQVVASREAVFEAGQSSIQYLLEAQRRLADAQVSYYQQRVAHALAILNVHRQKGTVLAFNGVELSEGAWVPAANRQVGRERFRHRDALLDYRTMRPQVSRGRYPQHPFGAADQDFEPLPAEMTPTPSDIEPDPVEEIPLPSVELPAEPSRLEPTDRAETEQPSPFRNNAIRPVSAELPVEPAALMRRLPPT